VQYRCVVLVHPQQDEHWDVYLGWYKLLCACQNYVVFSRVCSMEIGEELDLDHAIMWINELQLVNVDTIFLFLFFMIKVIIINRWLQKSYQSDYKIKKNYKKSFDYT